MWARTAPKARGRESAREFVVRKRQCPTPGSTMYCAPKDGMTGAGWVLTGGVSKNAKLSLPFRYRGSGRAKRGIDAENYIRSNPGPKVCVCQRGDVEDKQNKQTNL